jgi:hypothetical protein
VCDTSQSLCVDGCKKDDGSGCPDGKICIFPEADSEIGYCSVDGTPPDYILYTGCICGVPSVGRTPDFGWAVAASAALAAWWRRRAPRFE